MDTPANHMTPVIFAERVESLFAGDDAVEVVVRDQVKSFSYLCLARDHVQSLTFAMFYFEIHISYSVLILAIHGGS